MTNRCLDVTIVIEIKTNSKGVIDLNWLDKLERKIGRYAIPDLTKYLLGGYIIGYIIRFVMPGLVSWLTLEPGLILRGQVWRIFSWVLLAPADNLFFFAIMVFLYYSLGTSLERTWGTFRYNVYIISGILFTVIGAFVLYGILCVSYSTAGQIILFGNSSLFSTEYINMSIFLAFAVTYPDMEVLLYFILPVKMKWMGIVYGAMILYSLVMGNMVTRIAIVASILNFIIFFLSTRRAAGFSAKQRIRKEKFKQQSRPHMTYANGAKHRCAVCGRTELDDPCLEFRFCSKCNGNYEYCQDHLFTHEHVK